MESKFKVGDRVVGTEHAYPHRRGSNGVVVSIECDDIWVDWGLETHLVLPTEISHHGQTLADLNVKEGDVVECVYGTDCNGQKYTVEYGRHNGIYKGSEFNNSVRLNEGLRMLVLPDTEYYKFRIISRATPTPTWLPCPTDYVPQDNHEVTYHMGIPTHYYVVEKVMDCQEPCVIGGRPYTIKGQTLNGKPVGQWVIDMDKT